MIPSNRVRPHRLARWLFASLVLVLATPPLAAQTDCREDPACIAPGSAEGEPLRQPYPIRAENGKLTTTLDVRYFTNVVVGADDDGNDITMNLRMFGHPQDGRIVYSVPAPAYHIAKGEVFELTLTNSIDGAPFSPDDACNEATPVEPPDVYPNCFHGDNVTNFHFHGFHISPQRISEDRFYDYIFLKLNPKGTPCPEGDSDCVEGTAFVTSGEIPENQSEGTHWYHPHHHGATALQVMNGMAGAFLVSGEFDAQLQRFYGGELEEKVLVLQQVLGDGLFPDGGASAIRTLVNGQNSPQLSIGAGEIERWRIINANAAATSHNTFTFPPGYQVRQIAMDGVQFAPENYRDQPLLEGGLLEGFEITLAPGNRADFLVRGSGSAGEVLHEPATPALLHPDTRKRLLRGQVEPLLLVAPDAAFRRAAEAGPMRFPTMPEFPRMPSFLANVERVDRDRCVVFSMDGKAGDKTDIIQFLIDGEKFDHHCINQRMELDTAEQWTFLNEDSPHPDQNPIAHPAHIHVNPFQIWVRDGVSHIETFNPYPIWQDTIALPVEDDVKTVMRTRFENFEGRFVMHCHILGHEDRGMMQQLEVGETSGQPLCRPFEPDPGCEKYLAAQEGDEEGVLVAPESTPGEEAHGGH